MPCYGTSRQLQNSQTWSGQVLDPMVRGRVSVIGFSGAEACASICAGRNKLVINHLGRLFVTSDAATIIREIEVVHPAAKLLVMASQAQESEVCSFLISATVTTRKSRGALGVGTNTHGMLLEHGWTLPARFEDACSLQHALMSCRSEKQHSNGLCFT